MSKPFVMSMAQIQPSQLYLNEAKVASVTDDTRLLAPVPVTRLGGRVVHRVLLVLDRHRRYVTLGEPVCLHVPVVLEGEYPYQCRVQWLLGRVVEYSEKSSLWMGIAG